MKAYLPPATRPWSRKIERRHTPRPGEYSSFKACLRWEFGFSCAFCLLHEADLLKGGTAGWSLMQVEHSIPQSEDRSQRNIYTNCFYICERCNKSRGALPNEDDEGNILLDPCAAVWEDHFQRVEDSIRPRPEDNSARYTWESYDLDDPSKVRFRERRRHWMERYAETLVDISDLETLLVNKAIEEADSRNVSETVERLAIAQKLQRIKAPLLEKLAELAPIPQHHDIACLCGRTEELSLPEALAEQTVDLVTLLEQARARRQVTKPPPSQDT